MATDSTSGGPITAVQIVESLIAFVCLWLLIKWIYETKFGTLALVNSRPRRNSMSFCVPLIPLGVWLVLGGSAMAILKHFDKNFSSFKQSIFELSISMVVSLILFLVILTLIFRTFPRGLKGFGLRARTLGKDFGGAVVKLLTVLPVVSITIYITLGIGKLIMGPDWEIQKHQGLELLQQYPQTYMRVMLVILTVVLAPVIEEMLFRGLFQTMFRNYVKSPWLAIALTSAIFAISHQDPVHWATLFMLSMGLGYAYEKSGSIVQSMFMHALFNGASIIGALTQQ